MMFITERYCFMTMRCFRKLLCVRDVQYYCPFENGLIYQILHEQAKYLVFNVVISSERWRMVIPCMMLLSTKIYL